MPLYELSNCDHQSMEPDCQACQQWTEDADLDDLQPFEAVPGPLTSAPGHTEPCSRCGRDTRFREQDGTRVCSVCRE